MKKFNFSEYALKHQQLMFFIMFVFFIAGAVCYEKLGRQEMPSFNIRSMTITTYWPGATAKQVAEQVTEPIEKKLQETPGLWYVNSSSRPGVCVVHVNLDDPVPPEQIKPTWLKVRNMVADMQQNTPLPKGVQGPYFNDDYGDVYGIIFALTSDGSYTMSDLRYTAENSIRNALVNIPDVQKVHIQGIQQEQINIDIDNKKFATLGIDPRVIVNTLQQQNAVQAGGMFYTPTDNVYLRITGIFQSLEQIRNIGIEANNRVFRLGDIAKVYGSYQDPPSNIFYYNGQQCVGVIISMRDGGNILQLGENIDHAITNINQQLPEGMKLEKVCDQPEVVKGAIAEFVETLILAVLIVLGVSFLSLGTRAGFVVALSIPLVLCSTFIFMKAFSIDLHNISLGALIIALGLLVDDAMISIETMELKLSQGMDRFSAASYAYETTSISMLTGTLVTAAGFMPVYFSVGAASEFTGSIFVVVTTSLLLSWISAVTVIPVLGFHIMKEHKQLAEMKNKPSGKIKQFMQKLPILKHFFHEQEHNSDQEQEEISAFKTKFRIFLEWTLAHRRFVIAVTLIIFLTSLTLSPLIPKQFFPNSDRSELIVDLTLPEGSSLVATDTAIKKLIKILDGHPDIVSHTAYVGQSAPRFVLTFSVVDPDTNFGELVINTKSMEARDALKKMVDEQVAPQFPEARLSSWFIACGPPSAYPVMLRVLGPDNDKVQEIAQKIRNVLLNDSRVVKDSVNLNWYEKSKVAKLNIDQDKARQIGISTENLSTSLQSNLLGIAITPFYQGDHSGINLVLRTGEMPMGERTNLNSMKNAFVYSSSGTFIPLEQIASISYNDEYGLIARRELRPCVTVQADVLPGYQGNDVELDAYNKLADIRSQLPMNYEIHVDGALESSQRNGKSLSSVYPIMGIAVMFILMFQLQSIGKMLLVLSTAPLGMIGVNTLLSILQAPLGFVAQLGIIALFGMIIRNSVILVDQIKEHEEEGMNSYDAIIESTLLRFRPIMLTAAAAILGMIPLMTSTFWGPMAVAVAGGLLFATMLTLIYLPALYAACFKVKKP